MARHLDAAVHFDRRANYNLGMGGFQRKDGAPMSG
jgi:hypothetical protein